MVFYENHFASYYTSMLTLLESDAASKMMLEVDKGNFFNLLESKNVVESRKFVFFCSTEFAVFALQKLRQVRMFTQEYHHHFITFVSVGRSLEVNYEMGNTWFTLG